MSPLPYSKVRIKGIFSLAEMYRWIRFRMVLEKLHSDSVQKKARIRYTGLSFIYKKKKKITISFNMDCFSIVKFFLDSLTNHFDIATRNCKSEVQDFFFSSSSTLVIIILRRNLQDSIHCSLMLHTSRIPYIDPCHEHHVGNMGPQCPV